MGARMAIGARMAVAIVLASVALLSLGAEAAKEKVVITADERVTVDFDADVTVFEGGVKISYSDVSITADRAEVKERKVATITGRVVLVQPDMTLTGGLLTAYINEKRVVVEGNVTLAKDEGESAGEKERVVVTCDRMELRTSTRGFSAFGNVSVTRGETRARADRATYTEKDKLAVLEGNVQAEGKNRETVRCQKLLFRTDREYLEALDEVTLEFEVEEEEGAGEEEKK